MDNIWLKLMNIFRFSCHQKPSRSFYIYNYQLPVCARCTGMYIGYLIAALLFLIYDIKLSIILTIILIIPGFLDGFVQLRTKYESTNLKRFITGILLGIGYIYVIINLITKFINLLS